MLTGNVPTANESLRELLWGKAILEEEHYTSLTCFNNDA